MKKHSNRIFVFVNLSVDSGYYGVNHGIAYLVPIVRRNAFRVHVLHIVDDISGEDFRAQIEDLNPSVVGFSCTSPQLKYLKKYSKAIEGLPSVLQIAGGVGPTLDPEGVLAGTSVDGVAIGEGELPLDSLLKTLNAGGDIHSTHGFYWRTDGRIVKNPVPQFISDLSRLDLPDYSVFDRDVVQTGSGIDLILSRGCPYGCAYCCNKAIRSVYPSAGGYFRAPSVEHCMELLESVLQQYPGTKHVNFEDDLLIANKDWFLSFASEYRRRISVPYRVAIRTECVDRDIVRALKESGCDLVCLGLESGNEAVRRDLLKRHHSNAQILEKAKMVREVGMKLFTFNMVGLPFETKDQMRDTLELNRKIRSDCGACNFFYPFPGTELYDTCEREGLIEPTGGLLTQSNYSTRPVLRLTRAQERDAIRARKKLLNYFYWQDLRYEHRRSSSCHSGPAVALKLARLLGIYLLKRLSSPHKKGSLYRRVIDSKARIRLWQRISSARARAIG